MAVATRRSVDNPEGVNGANWVPRTVVIAGKAASAYQMPPRLIVRLAHDVARRHQRATRAWRDKLEARLPAELQRERWPRASCPAADLSEQISTAGTEASGTGNMKFAHERRAHHRHLGRRQHRDGRGHGHRRTCSFSGLRADAVAELIKQLGYDPAQFVCRRKSTRCRQCARRHLLPGRSSAHGEQRAAIGNWWTDHLLGTDDVYLLMADFADYVATQAKRRRAVQPTVPPGPELRSAQHCRHGPVLIRSHDCRDYVGPGLVRPEESGRQRRDADGSPTLGDHVDSGAAGRVATPIHFRPSGPSHADDDGQALGAGAAGPGARQRSCCWMPKTGRQAHRQSWRAVTRRASSKAQ